MQIYNKIPLFSKSNTQLFNITPPYFSTFWAIYNELAKSINDYTKQSPTQ